ncbi:MAG: Hsp20/alpha crystallin family protein [Proteobacteria bacterium]|nr:Hsp20/alpha crystallin family protein [Pseudomonadota bacterium]
MASQQGFEHVMDFINKLQKSDSPFLKNMENFCAKKFPIVNIVELNDEQILIAELAGFKKNEINIEIQGYQVRISGKRDNFIPDGSTSVYTENSESDFDRSFKTPYQIDAATVKATMEDGILQLKLPRSEGDKPHKVDIT